MKKLEGKVAIVTGGNSGIGLATAIEFQKQGAKVGLIGRNPETMEETKKALNNDVVAIQGDIANLADIDRLIEKTHKAYGKIDILFINAAVAFLSPIEAVTEEFFDHTVSVNFKGAYFTIQKALPFMNDGGSIVLNSSISSHIGQHSLSVYAATKAALSSLARTLSTELAPRGIRINIVSPGQIDTPIPYKTGLPKEVIEEFLEASRLKTLNKRLGAPEEVAKAVTFLASADSSYIMATELIVDGGFTLVS